MIKQVLLYHLIFSLIFTGSAWILAAPHKAMVVALGCGVIGLNLPLVFWSWSRIFKKKSIALAAGVIVFKYAILGVIIYLVTSRPELDGGSLLVGLTSIVPTMVLFTLRNTKKNHENGL